MRPSTFRLVRLVVAALFPALVTVLGQVAIPLPFTPVPITGQTLGVMLAGALLGARLGFLSMALFVLLVAVGLPLLSSGKGGIGALLGPTGGYVLGFPVAAGVTGWLVERFEKGGRPVGPAKLFVAIAAGGLVVEYVLGASWLAVVANLTPVQALVNGVLPFIPGDVLKAVLAALLAAAIRRAYPVRQRLGGVPMGQA